MTGFVVQGHIYTGKQEDATLVCKASIISAQYVNFNMEYMDDVLHLPKCLAYSRPQSTLCGVLCPTMQCLTGLPFQE